MHFSSESSCILYGTHLSIAQNMLDYDYLCDRGPSIAAFMSEMGSGKQHKLFYGDKEFFVPVIGSWDELDDPKFEKVDTLINLASFRSATAVNKSALESAKFKQIFTIAEGIPERESRELISLQKQYPDTTLLGPSIVGGMICGVFRIGHTGGSLENILASRLYRKGSVGIVSKSGGMMNELCRVVSKCTDGVHTALQIGGDRYAMTSFETVLKYYESNSEIKLIVLMGEVGNESELKIAEMFKSGEITKPIVALCIGTAAENLKSEVQFGHAGAKANSDSEKATYKNQYMSDAGIFVSDDYTGFAQKIGEVYEQKLGIITPDDPSLLEAINVKIGVLKSRRKTRFSTTITDERGEELKYNGTLISDFVNQGSIGKVIGNLWLKRDLPDYACKFIETILILSADHGPAVSGAANTIITARAGKDLVSSLISGLATIGPRFGGAIDGAAIAFSGAIRDGLSPIEFVNQSKKSGKYIQGIGHKVKSRYNPDKRCEILQDISSTFPDTAHLDFAKQVEELTLEKKSTLILNVDGYIGAMLVDMMKSIGMSDKEIQSYIQMGLCNAFFVLARSIGFIGHFLDQNRLNEGLYRTPWEDVFYDVG